MLGFLSSWIWFLGIFVLAKTGYSASLIFYDAMLTDVTDPERMDAAQEHKPEDTPADKRRDDTNG